MRKLSKYEEQGFEGVDNGLDISLFEYGLIWRKEGDGPEYKFIYGVVHDGRGYSSFDYAFIDPISLANETWIEWNEVSAYAGQDVRAALRLGDVRAVVALVGYYGTEEVFGGSYYTFTIEET